MVTKNELDAALTAWDESRKSAVHTQSAWALLLENHGALIASLRKNGHNWSQAQSVFQGLSAAHSEALQATWKVMDERCREYQALHSSFTTQNQ